MRFLQFSWLYLLVLLSILFDANNSWVHGQGPCLNDQRALLLQLNQSLSFFSPSGFSLTPSKLLSWSTNTDCCSWDGVDCDAAGHVTSLDLSNKFISGGIDNSSSLFGLRYLQRLNLAFNTIRSATIPSGFDRLANLTYLNLSNSGFTGQIPIEISRMTRLVTLDISTFSPGSTSLMLRDPDFGTLIRNLRELRELWLDGVNISADGNKWCKALSSSLPNLQVLSLSNCYISGPFDSSLLQLRSLYEIRLNQNNISAEVPELFANFSNLTSLHLSSCGLYGTFPERILQIRTLQTLYLSNNKRLYGSLPEFPKDGLLQTLVLSETTFSGKIPNSIGNLRLLSRLELDNCGFSGSIPASMENLNQLQYLDLSSNHFTGQIPPIRWSESLIKIDLAHNRLTGPVPSHWDKLMKLTILTLKNNSLNGTIPPTLFTLPSLQKLDLSQNQFTGPLRNFNGSSSLLDTLDLSINKLVGPIPTSLFKLSSLIVLTLSSNNFNGTESLGMFFQEFRNLSSLDLSGISLSINTSGAISAPFPQVGTLKLRSCNLRVFPIFLRSQSKLNHLDLSDNQIRRRIPNWIHRIGNGTLSHLNLSYNFLEDAEQPFPDNSFRTLGVLDLRSNMLQGKNSIVPSSASVLDYSFNNFTSIIPNITSFLSVAIFFSLSSNKLTGEIPKSICEAGFIQVFDVSNNSLSGSIPPCLGAVGSLRVLNLRGNNFHGIMPQMFPENCNLRTLDLNGNRLEGQVARSLANCKMLEVLDLGNNQISGTFPSWLANMSQLRVLVLRANKFQGPLGNPGTGHNFPMLQIIDISSNKFTGTLSNECFASWKAMMINEEEAESNRKRTILGFGVLELTHLYYQDAVTVTSKGLDMELVKILTVFTCIDFSNNKFEREIPEIIGSLRSLYVLNLSINALTGPIPSSLGNLTQLESLDLSQNKLTGMIPFQLAGLSFLSFLNLSFNNLVGMIPPGRQFQTFNETAFEGNNGLCGPPLLTICNDTAESPHTHSDSNAEVDWQFIITGLGFGGGVGMVFGPLLFWKKGRQWYNEHINRILSMIFPGLFHLHCDDGRVDADDSIEEELTEMTGDYDDYRDEEDEEWFKGHYCVFCTKLDISRRKAIHNPNCNCYISPLNSS